VHAGTHSKKRPNTSKRLRRTQSAISQRRLPFPPEPNNISCIASCSLHSTPFHPSLLPFKFIVTSCHRHLHASCESFSHSHHLNRARIPTASPRMIVTPSAPNLPTGRRQNTGFVPPTPGTAAKRVKMLGLTSAAGLLSLLQEDDSDLKLFALKRLDDYVDVLWPEIADSIGTM
jgi:hypothetical protein